MSTARSSTVFSKEVQMGSFLIMMAFIAALMFICSFVYKLLADAASRVGNATRRHFSETKSEDLKEKY